MVTKLDGFSDYVRFCAVCPEWCGAALESNAVHKVKLDVLKSSRKKLPVLIVKTSENHDTRSIFNVSTRTTFEIKLPISYKYKFSGSSRGWLFCLTKNMVLTLVNPINNCCISLPPIKEPREFFKREWHKYCFDFYINKGILLSNPDVCPSSFEVVVIHGGMNCLAFLNSSERLWSFINPEDFCFGGAIHYKGKLYGVNVFGKLVEVDIPTRTIKTIVPATLDYTNAVHLVESQEGELLMVRRRWLGDADGIDFVEDHQNIEAEHCECVHVEAEHGVDLHVVEENSNNEDNGDTSDDESESYDSDASETPPIRDFDDEDYPRSFEFKIYKMTYPFEEGSATWTEIKNIGQQALFVGDNDSVSVSTRDFPGCIPNSVYFITLHHNYLSPYIYRGLYEDSEVYNLENGRFYWHHMLDFSEKYMQPPIWLVPSPQEMNLL